jgi:hypothetical protein
MSARNDDRRWMTDTLTRISLRHGRALHALSLISGPLALAYLLRDPAEEDVQDAADALDAAVAAAIHELLRIEAYVAAISDRDALYPLASARGPRPTWNDLDTDLCGTDETQDEVTF